MIKTSIMENIRSVYKILVGEYKENVYYIDTRIA